MRSNKPVAVLIFLLTTGCLVISLMMTRQSGVSSAGSSEGKLLIGWASVLIHSGMPIFGIAGGIAAGWGHKSFARGCTFIVWACALFSFVNVLQFVAAERISLTQAHQAETKAKAAREKAALDAEAKRANEYSKMVQDQLSWNRGTAKDVDGRKSRNDMIDANTKLIQDYGKAPAAAAPTAPEPKQEVTVRAEAGMELLSEWTGYSVSGLQMASILLVVTMLLLFEVFGWKKAAFLWFADRDSPLPATPAGILPPDEPAPRLERANPKLLAPPKVPKVITVRSAPSAEWRQLLDQVEFPPNGSRHKGPLRPRLDPTIQALRFVCWMGAYDERGDFHNESLDQIYEEFLSADHRELTTLRQVKPEMEAIKGKVASKRYVQGSGTTWHVQPPSLERMKTLLEKAKVIEIASAREAAKAEPTEPDPEPSESKSVTVFPFWKTRQAGQVH